MKYLKSFNNINEAMATLSKDDDEVISDILFSFAEKWNLTLLDMVRDNGYISFQRFDKFYMQLGLQLDDSFKGDIDEIELDITNTIDRIKKYGYDVMETSWGNAHSLYITYSFQISHSDVKSKEVMNDPLNKCWKFAKVNTKLPENDIYNYVKKLHRNEHDFYEGDVIDRLEEFKEYTLMYIDVDKIELEEWELDMDYVKKYKKMYNDNNDYPPIVLGDYYMGKYTIIDGNHRANALSRLNVNSIRCWVGSR